MLTRIPRAARRPLAKRAVAWGLTLALICLPMGGLLTAAQAQSPNIPANNPTVNGPALPPPLPVSEPAYGANSILLFPFTDNTNNPAAAGLAGQVADALKLRISLVGSYTVLNYSKFLAPIQRAVDDGVLQPTDLAGPFDPQKAGKLAAQIQTNDYLTGAIESYTADAAARRVTIEVSANLRNTRTGNSLRTLAFTGTGIAFSNADTMDVVTQRAVNIVASKLASAIYPGRAAPMVVPASERGHSKAGQVLLVSLLTGALLYAILHNSSNNGSSNNSTTTGGAGGGGTGSGGGSNPGGPPAPPGVP